jgi:hypothetical protein
VTLLNWLSIWAIKRPTVVGIRKVVVRRPITTSFNGTTKTNSIEKIILIRNNETVADLYLPKKYTKNGNIR